MIDKPKRDANGRLLPGQSANPSGRPKTSKLTGKDKKEFVEIFRKAIQNKQLDDAIAWLCERANDTNEIFKIMKEFAPYIMPKLSSLKSEVSQIKQVKISFVEAEEPKMIEGEVVEEVKEIATEEKTKEQLAIEKELKELEEDW